MNSQINQLGFNQTENILVQLEPLTRKVWKTLEQKWLKDLMIQDKY